MRCPRCKCEKFMRIERAIVKITKEFDIDVNGTILTDYICFDCREEYQRMELV